MKRWIQFVRWLWSTPWPTYALTMLHANIWGAVFVFSFLRFGLPLEQFIDMGSYRLTNQYIFFGYLVLAVAIGGIISTWLIYPVLISYRRGGEYAERARRRALRIPFHQAILQAVIWFVGTAVFVGLNYHISPKFALLVGATSLLGATTTVLMSYMHAERVLRPITVSALSGAVPVDRSVPGVRRRILIGWALTTVVPAVGILGIIAGQRFGFFSSDANQILFGLTLLAIATIVAGAVGMLLVTSAIADPLKELKMALRRVERGDLDTRVTIYDGSELGMLQAGFNAMVRGLQERESIQELFGRYVGEEVVLNALEHGTQLGGQEREVAVLFIDLVRSTEFTMNNAPHEVVNELNNFFRIVVEAVDRNGGFVNKFLGDAALAVFGAPLEVENPAGSALRAARELNKALEGNTPLDAGIGVSYGTVIAGHIGHSKRFEYTVIGDPVNEAARLTSLSKWETDGILASASVLRHADPTEAQRWVLGRSVELRGRGQMTQLARPLRPTLADRYHARATHEASDTWGTDEELGGVSASL